jgi:hypothetical protein
MSLSLFITFIFLTLISHTYLSFSFMTQVLHIIHLRTSPKYLLNLSPNLKALQFCKVFICSHFQETKVYFVLTVIFLLEKSIKLICHK